MSIMHFFWVDGPIRIHIHPPSSRTTLFGPPRPPPRNRHWTGSAPPPGPLPKVFLALGKWRHFQTYWGADYSWGLLQTITTVVGEPLFILPPPFSPVGPQGTSACLDALCTPLFDFMPSNHAPTRTTPNTNQRSTPPTPPTQKQDPVRSSSSSPSCGRTSSSAASAPSPASRASTAARTRPRASSTSPWAGRGRGRGQRAATRRCGCWSPTARRARWRCTCPRPSSSFSCRRPRRSSTWRSRAACPCSRSRAWWSRRTSRGGRMRPYRPSCWGTGTA